MNREVIVVVCDSCQKTVEIVTKTAALPRPWRHLTLRDSSRIDGAHEGSVAATQLDVCSPGCGEKALIHAVRDMNDAEAA